MAFGVAQQKRRVYKTWEHGGLFPQVVIEHTSASTRLEDLGRKRVLYAELGVQEYYLFDPHGEYLKPRLRGYQLSDGELVPLPGPRMFGLLLKLELRAEGAVLQLIDSQTGKRLLASDDREAAVQREAEGRAKAESERLKGKM